jgi:hypothetical protein
MANKPLPLARRPTPHEALKTLEKPRPSPDTEPALKEVQSTTDSYAKKDELAPQKKDIMAS